MGADVWRVAGMEAVSQLGGKESDVGMSWAGSISTGFAAERVCLADETKRRSAKRHKTQK